MIRRADPDPASGGWGARLRRRAARLVGGALHLALPRICLGCSEPVPSPAPSGSAAAAEIGLCAACRRLLRRRESAACDRCGRPDAGDVPCPACRRRPVPWERLVWAFHYGPPLDQVVAGLKFRRLEYLAEGLVAAAWPTLEEQLDAARDEAAFDAVVPVPLHWRRRLERGYDQARSLAEHVSPRVGASLLTALRRRRSTPAQSLLDRAARRRNLAGAFALRRPVEGRHCLLVDDVVTTGATLELAASELLAGGAASVVALCVARTPGVESTKNATKT